MTTTTTTIKEPTRRRVLISHYETHKYGLDGTQEVRTDGTYTVSEFRPYETGRVRMTCRKATAADRRALRNSS